MRKLYTLPYFLIETVYSTLCGILVIDQCYIVVVASAEKADQKRFVKDEYYQGVVQTILTYMPHADIHIFSQVQTAYCIILHPYI
jgi:hypothetical protein